MVSTYGSDQSDVLVLSDEAGNMYAIPRQVVEQHMLTDQERAQIESQLDEDVSGYSMYQQVMNQYMASEHQAESRQGAAEAHMARQATSANEESTSSQATAGARLGGMMTGVWRSLPFSKPASSDA